MADLKVYKNLSPEKGKDFYECYKYTAECL